MTDSHLFVSTTVELKHLQPGRLKCSALAVSASWIALGTHSGSVFFFERSTLRFVQLVSDSITGKITSLAFSPDERFLAAVTEDDTNCHILEPRLRARTDVGRVVLSVTEHKERITALLWAFTKPMSPSSGQSVSSASSSDEELSLVLFTGDFSGVVFKTPLQLHVSQILATRTASEYVYKCDSEVVQLDWVPKEQLLVASSRTRCDIVDFAAQTARPIGKQPRNGICGVAHSSSDQVQILCARPLKRVWSADKDGRVLTTYKFEDSLKEIVATPFFGGDSNRTISGSPDDIGREAISKRVQLGRLVRVADVLVSWSEDTVSVLDIDAQRVVQVHLDGSALHALVVCPTDGALYALHGPLESLRFTSANFRLNVRVGMLIERAQYVAAAQVLSEFRSHPEYREARALLSSSLERASVNSSSDHVRRARELLLNLDFVPSEAQENILHVKDDGRAAEPPILTGNSTKSPSVPISLNESIPAVSPEIVLNSPAPLSLTGEFTAAVMVKDEPVEESATLLRVSGDEIGNSSRSSKKSRDGKKKKRVTRLVDIAPASPLPSPSTQHSGDLETVSVPLDSLSMLAYSQSSSPTQFVPSPSQVLSGSQVSSSPPVSALDSLANAIESGTGAPAPSLDDDSSSSDSETPLVPSESSGPSPPGQIFSTRSIADLTRTLHMDLSSYRVGSASRALHSGPALALLERQRRTLSLGLRAWLVELSSPSTLLAPLSPMLDSTRDDLLLAMLDISCSIESEAQEVIQSNSTLFEPLREVALSVVAERGWSGACDVLLSLYSEDEMQDGAVRRALERRDLVGALSKLRTRNSLGVILRYLSQLNEVAENSPGMEPLVVKFFLDQWPSFGWRIVEKKFSAAVFVPYAYELSRNYMECRQDSILITSAFVKAFEYRTDAGVSVTSWWQAHLRHHSWSCFEGVLKEWISGDSNGKYSITVHIISELCRAAYFAFGVVEFALRLGDPYEAATVALQCDDIDTFRRIIKHPIARCSSDFWRRIMTMSRTVASSLSPEQLVQRELKETVLVEMMLQCLGAQETLAALRSPLVEGSSNHFAVKLLLQRSRRESHLHRLAQNSVSALDAYVWSSRHAVLGPQFRAVMVVELQGDGSDLPFVSSSRRRSELNFDYDLAVPRSLEDVTVARGCQSRPVSSTSSFLHPRIPAEVVMRSAPPFRLAVELPAGLREIDWALPESSSVTSRLSFCSD